MNPTNTVFDAKRLIGRLVDDEVIKEDLEHWAFEVTGNAERKPLINIDEDGERKAYTPEEISAMVLTKMKETAEAFLGKTVTSAVITVPAYFNDAQRRATQDAGAIAGLKVLRIINEPTAAAIAYGLDKKTESTAESRNVLIFDLGGGTFDVSLLNLAGGVFSVLATAGDTHLGGEDFDNNMVAHCQALLAKKHSEDISGNPRALRRLRTACERAKRALSTSTSAVIDVESLANGIDFRTKISRAKFEAMNAALFKKCLDPVGQVLADANLDQSAVTDVVLVGGSTRIPKIQEMLRSFFDGKELNQTINPDEAVAYGAAVQAAIITGQNMGATKDLLLLDVTPLSLGVDTVGGVMSVIIPRNTKIPCRREDDYTTVEDGQTSIDFDIYEGERPHVDANNRLGGFRLDGIPSAPRGEAKVRVTMSIDVNGVLSVTARDLNSGSKANVTISNSAGRLSQTDIDRMIAEAQRHREEDKKTREVQKLRSELEAFAYATRDTMEGYTDEGVRIPDKSLDAVDEAVNDALEWLDAHPRPEPEEVIEAREALEAVFKPINATSLREKRKMLRKRAERQGKRS